MRSDQQLRSELRAALEAVTPPAPWLAHRVGVRLRIPGSEPEYARRDRGFRLGLNAIAILVLVALAIAALGVFLAGRQLIGTAHPGTGSVLPPGNTTSMLTATTGWAASNYWGASPVWRTTDGGRTWKEVTPPTPDGFTYSSAPTGHYFLDGARAWVTATGLPDGAQSGSALSISTLATGDGGNKWTEGQPILGLQPYGELYPQLYFRDANHGWLTALTLSGPQQAVRVLYGTDDAGAHWHLLNRFAGMSSGCASTLVFATLTTGWMADPGCQAGRVAPLVTHDGGASWQIQPLPIPISDSALEPLFFDRTNGIFQVYGSKGALLVSTDGGETWSARSLPGEVQIGASFVDARHGWLLAGSSARFGKAPPYPSGAVPLYRTTDGGLTWRLVPNDLQMRTMADALESIYFVDQNNGFATYVTADCGRPSQLMTTSDGGYTWTVVAALKVRPLNCYSN